APGCCTRDGGRRSPRPCSSTPRPCATGWGSSARRTPNGWRTPTSSATWSSRWRCPGGSVPDADLDRRTELDGARDRAQPVVRLLDRPLDHRPRGVARLALGEGQVEGQPEPGHVVAALVLGLVALHGRGERLRLRPPTGQEVDVDRAAA